MRDLTHRKFVTSGLAVVLLLCVVLACGWYPPPPPPPPPPPANRNQNQTTPSPRFSPVSEARLRRYLVNVKTADRKEQSWEPLLDDFWRDISGRTLIQTDENGEGWLKLQDCMLIYVFQMSEMVTAPCSKAEMASGHVNCQLAGTAAYNNSCETGAQLLIQTPTAEITPHGTWFSVTYLPVQQLTLVLVFDGTASVKPIIDTATHSFGEANAVEAGQLWFTVPDNRSAAISNLLPQRVVKPISESQTILNTFVGPWIDRIRERAKQDGVNVPSFEAPASPSPTPPAGPTAEEVIDCDCSNLEAGRLTRRYQVLCRQMETNLRSQFREAGRVVGRCDPKLSGPNARPK